MSNKYGMTAARNQSGAAFGAGAHDEGCQLTNNKFWWKFYFLINNNMLRLHFSYTYKRIFNLYGYLKNIKCLLTWK